MWVTEMGLGLRITDCLRLVRSASIFSLTPIARASKGVRTTLVLLDKGAHICRAVVARAECVRNRCDEEAKLPCFQGQWSQGNLAILVRPVFDDGIAHLPTGRGQFECFDFRAGQFSSVQSGRQRIPCSLSQMTPLHPSWSRPPPRPEYFETGHGDS
ncbi:hypothetical protein VFPBJ_02128 [Purpureocillium lilacinum]|uniref:Uncharacterized protein n=1 Tax=Purpureocillium lilacinum TaxID=33203 RepID=A0A179HD18_PURLI|nr:hypothetical protein VFPBJ_02128 [Purpureocillium lilacinum]